MARTAKTTAFFGDADHDFRIGIGEAEELDELFSLGLAEIAEQVVAVRVPVLKQVLRLGLIGGGLKKDEAARLVGRHLVAGYFIEYAEVAYRAIDAALRGIPDDPPGESKGEAEAETSPPSQTDGSATA